MFRYAKNVRLASFLLSLALTGSLPVSLWLFMALCDSHSGPHWLSLPLSGILWLPLAHYCSLILCIQPLISSQGPFSALIADATMTHFLPLWVQCNEKTGVDKNRSTAQHGSPTHLCISTNCTISLSASLLKIIIISIFFDILHIILILGEGNTLHCGLM